MRILRHFASGLEIPFRSPVVALGNFDGLHLGHQSIVARTIELAGRMGGDPIVFTFYPHPAAVIAPAHAPAQIASLAARLRGLRRLGVAGVVLQRFTPQFAAIEAEEFVREQIVGRLGASGLVVGYNVTFGRGRRGTPALLEKMAPELGLEVSVVSAVESTGGRVSSSQIRQAVKSGDVAAAKGMLGGAHLVSGRVREGDRRGSTIGFPTANLLPRERLLPPDGVYAVRVGFEGEDPVRPGVANLGTNPTFGGVGRRLEVHLFDFDADLYGKTLVVGFEERLRKEIRFSSADELVAQIRNDAAEARALLGRES